MTTLLEEPPAQAAAPSARLRLTMAAVRVSFVWLGCRKTLSQEQKAQAADTFGAEGDYVSAAKKLLDTSHPAFKAVSSLKSRIATFWRCMSLPYPEAGIRLIRQDDIDPFQLEMTSLKGDLEEAVRNLNEHYSELKSQARRQLGRLFSAGDYPPTLEGLFECSWDFPSVEPPEYLRQLSPQLYEQEAARVAARFDEAVQMAEQAFTEELSKLVSHLTGGGIRGGQVYGASDKMAAYPTDHPVRPEDLIATIYSAMGISPEAMLYDQQNRPQRACEGEPLLELFG